MQYFDRVCKIEVENDKKLIIQNFRIKFEVIKSAVSKENQAKIEIYNLSNDTRKTISEINSLIRISAGYSQNVGLVEIGQGDITRVRTNRTDVDTITEIFLADGLKTLKTKLVTLSYAKDVRLQDMISNLQSQTGLKFRLMGIDKVTNCEGGYSDLGTLDEILNNLSSIYNFKWSMQNGTVLIQGTQSLYSDSILLLSAESGLILNPSNFKKDDRKVVKDETKKRTTEYVVQALLQPQLQIADTIALKSQDLNGKFIVQKITHYGDTMGNDWYSEIELKV